MCTHVCTFLLQNGLLRVVGPVYYGICATVQYQYNYALTIHNVNKWDTPPLKVKMSVVLHTITICVFHKLSKMIKWFKIDIVFPHPWISVMLYTIKRWCISTDALKLKYISTMSGMYVSTFRIVSHIGIDLGISPSFYMHDSHTTTKLNCWNKMTSCLAFLKYCPSIPV